VIQLLSSDAPQPGAVEETLNGWATAGGWAPCLESCLQRPLDQGHHEEPEPVGRTGRCRSSTVLGFFPPSFHLRGPLLPPGFPGLRNDRNRPRRAGFEFRL